MDEIVSLKLWGTPCFYKTDYLNRFQANKCLKWVMYCGIGLIIMTILESELGRMLASCTVVNKSLNHASHEKSLLVPEIVFRHTIGNKIWIVFASCWAEYLRDVIKWQDVSKHSNKDYIEWAKHNRVSAPYWKRFHFVFFDAFGRAWSLATVSLQVNYDRGIFFRFLFGNNVTYVDLGLLHVLRATEAQFPEAWAAQSLPLLKAFKQRMEERPRIAAYINSDRYLPFSGNSMM